MVGWTQGTRAKPRTRDRLKVLPVTIKSDKLGRSWYHSLQDKQNLSAPEGLSKHSLPYLVTMETQSVVTQAFR